MSIEVGAIDRIIKNAIEVMDSSKYQIFEISEGARSERDALNKELQQVIEETKLIIEKVDKLEIDYRRARIRLSEVSRDFKSFSEQDIKAAYETANQFQFELFIYREKEQGLKMRREDLHRRTRNVEQTIERAEVLVSQVNVVLEYLSGDLNQVTRILESAKNRQQLGLKIIMAQEEERKRIAREVHDGPAQTLANVVLRTEIAERMMIKGEHDSARQEIGDLKGQVRSGLEEVRKVIFNLRPMTLDDLGLVPTLRKFAQDFEEKNKLHTEFNITGKETRLPSGLEVAIYRLVQEAASNVLKHASATHLSIELTYQKKMVKLIIQDNGAGFNLDKIQYKINKGKHFGLMGMRERVELLEGRFEIESEEQAGTQITIVIPYELDQGKELDHGKE